MKIAIIGLAIKLPDDINTIDDLYKKLKDKEDCIKKIPNDRIHIDSFHDNDNDIGYIKTNQAGIINDIYKFDNSFFKILNKESKTMDPQQKLLLMSTYDTINDANISLNQFKNTNTGVFIGSCNTEHYNNLTSNKNYCNEYSVTGGLLTLLSNRISYFYNLKGPSMTIDTACSSSGYALHLAVESLKKEETDMCIVGGSNLLINPETFVGFSQGHFLSPDGRCKTFDKDANGYVRSEGIVTLLLKPLDKAIKDGNKIYGSILSTCVNQDGKTNSITMPSLEMQKKLLEKSYQHININDITYIEAHGTGTKIGDFIETNSLGSVIGSQRKDPLKIGSIKSVIGHTEATSGLAGIVKILAMMKYRKILPNLHFNEPPEDIDLNELNLEVVNKVSDIEDDKIIMGINNYGFGGSNFHCVIENFNNDINESVINTKINNIHILSLYGNDLDAIDTNVCKFLELDEKEFLKYLYNANFKDKLDEAKIFLIRNKDDYEEIIFNPNENKNSVVYGKFSKSDPKICFVFGGQGSQYDKMGLTLMKDFKIFEDCIIKCDSIWEKIYGFSFIDKYGVFTDNIKNKDLFDDPIVAQPSILFFQIAMIELLKSFDVEPNTVIGHSAGELASFYASKSISLEDTIKISYYRSIGQQKTVGLGNMLVVNDNVNKIEEYLSKYKNLELAVINSSKCFVLAGDRKFLEECILELEKSNIKSTIIKGRCGFHSSKQDSIKDFIIENTKNIYFSNPICELVSSVFGYGIDKTDYSKDYWWKNIREPVLFKDTIEYCSDCDIFIEISPHSVLSYYLNTENKYALKLKVSSRKEDESKLFLSSLAKLYFSGKDINFENFGIKNNKYVLNHQWSLKDFKFIPKSVIDKNNGIINKYNQLVVNIDEEPYIRDHIIGNKNIMPTVKYIDLILKYILPEGFDIINFKINKMLIINKDDNEITFLVKQNNCNYNLTYKGDVYLEFDIEKSNKYENIDINSDINKLIEDNKMLNPNDSIKIISNKGFNFKKNMINFGKSYYNDKIIVSNYKKNIYHPTLIDISLLNAMIHQNLSNSFLYIPNRIKKISNYQILNSKFNDCQVINYKKISNYKKVVNDSYITNGNNILLKMEDIECINISTNETSLYNFNNTILDCNNSLKPLEISTNNLLEIRNILLDNKNENYLIKLNSKYEKIGFIKTIINEIDNPKFKICYCFDDNYDPRNLSFCNIENYYISNKTYSQHIEKINISELNKTFNKTNYYLHYSNKKDLNSIKFKINNDKPDNNMVKVKVQYSALNFKDMAVIMDFVDDINIGYEFSGTVIESSSDNFQEGDIVCCYPEYGKGFGDICLVDEKYIFKVPKELDFKLLSSIGISYGTAYLALIYFANVQKDDLILIHNASGALGLASLEITKMIGCKVIASCSTKEKEEYLMNNYSNIDLITDSRNYNKYTNDINNFTENKGVDVILASSYDKFIEANISLLKPGGKYLDVGKRQLIENKPIVSKYFLKSISYIGVHFDRLMKSNNNLIRNILNKVFQLINESKLKVFKISEYNLSDYKNVFKEFSKSKHIGKIVLKHDNIEDKEFIEPDYFLDNNKYYLITGGMGGIGEKLIEFLSINGAKNFIVTTRKKESDIQAKFIKKFDCLNLVIIIDDLLNNKILENKLKNYNIDGVFHLAGCIKDKFAKDMCQEDLDDVIRIKKEGIINLSKVFESKEHRYFVGFSSIVSVIGNPGQSNYSAGNSFMDYYLKERNDKGLPGLSINLGAIGGCGMIADKFGLANIMLSKGIDFTHYYHFFEILKKILLSKSKYSNLLITDQDWNKLKHLNTKNLFESFITNNQQIEVINIKEKLVNYLKNLLEIDLIDEHKNLLSYGVDSLISVQIATYCTNELGINLKQIDVLQGITINEIMLRNVDYQSKSLNDVNKEDKFYFVSKYEIDRKELVRNNNKLSNYRLICILICIILFVFYYLFF